MSEIEAAFTRTAAATALAFGVAACGNSVHFAQAGGTSGGASSGAGGSASLPPPACAPGEGAIVAAGAEDHPGVIATFRQGAWIDDASVLPASWSRTTFVTTDQRLGVFWTNPDPLDIGFALTDDGASFDVKAATGWVPDDGVISAVKAGLVLGAPKGQMSLGSLDPVTLVWSPYLPPIPLERPGSATALPGGEILAAGTASDRLCTVTTSAGAWGSVECRKDVLAYDHGFYQGLLTNFTPPIPVTLPDGDVVIVYSPSPSPGLAATTLHAGVWSAPDPIASPVIQAQFAAAATPVGDVIVVSGTWNTLAALRYRPGVGWSDPIPIDASGERVAVASGICGDDALIAYSAGAHGEEVRVARVRGSASETSTVAHLDDWAQLSIATLTASTK